MRRLVAILSLVATPLLAAERGAVLIVEHLRVIEGEIERVGERYCVRREGGETWLPVSSTRELVPDLVAAYERFRQATPERDVAARLRLAQWCLTRNLRPQALAEVEAAVALDPAHKPARELWLQLRRPAPLPTTVIQPPTVRPPAAKSDDLALFANRIQPIVMNACVGCHAGERAGPFRLEPTHAVGVGDPRVTAANRSAALALCDTAEPMASKLVRMASTAHGSAKQPPVRSPVALRSLDEWARLQIAPPSMVTPTAATVPATGEFGVSAPPKPQEGPRDPFDPILFNRPAPTPPSASSP